MEEQIQDLSSITFIGALVLLVMAGWASLLYRIRAEERMLSRDPGWPAYAARVRYRLLPGLW